MVVSKFRLSLLKYVFTLTGWTEASYAWLPCQNKVGKNIFSRCSYSSNCTSLMKRIRSFGAYALYKSTFYLLTYFYLPKERYLE